MEREAVAARQARSGLVTIGEREGRVIIFLTTALFGLIVDQGSKWLATSELSLVHSPAQSNGVSLSLVHNPGLLAGFGSTMPLVLEAITGLLLTLAALSAMSLLSSHRSEPRRLFALALLLAGGLGNLLDRMTTGGVIDFIQVGCLTLNVADLLLLAGGLLYGDPFQALGRVPRRSRRFDAGDALRAPSACSPMSWAASAAPAEAPCVRERVAVPVGASTPRG